MVEGPVTSLSGSSTPRLKPPWVVQGHTGRVRRQPGLTGETPLYHRSPLLSRPDSLGCGRSQEGGFEVSKPRRLASCFGQALASGHLCVAPVVCRGSPTTGVDSWVNCPHTGPSQRGLRRDHHFKTVCFKQFEVKVPHDPHPHLPPPPPAQHQGHRHAEPSNEGL